MNRIGDAIKSAGAFLRTYGTRIILGLCLIAAVIAFFKLNSGLFHPAPAAAPMQAAHEAAPVAGLIKQPLPQPVIVKAYPKAQAAKKLKLPQAVTDNPTQQVISTADLAPSPGGYTTATVLDVQTGDAVTHYTEKPRPLFGFGGLTEIGARYGLSTRGGQQGTIYARQDLLRVSAVTVSGYGEVNAGALSAPEAKAQVDVRISW